MAGPVITLARRSARMAIDWQRLGFSAITPTWPLVLRRSRFWTPRRAKNCSASRPLRNTGPTRRWPSVRMAAASPRDWPQPESATAEKMIVV